MANAEIPAKLYPLITQGVELLRELQELIAQERTALEKRDLDGIEQCATRKADLLARIKTNFNERHELMQSAGIELSGEGWTAYIDTLPEKEAKLLSEAWNTLSTLLEANQRESLVNQQLVHRGQENTNRLLNLLQGKNQKSELYGSSGSRSNFSTQSRLGKA